MDSEIEPEDPGERAMFEDSFGDEEEVDAEGLLGQLSEELDEETEHTAEGEEAEEGEEGAEEGFGEGEEAEEEEETAEGLEEEEAEEEEVSLDELLRAQLEGKPHEEEREEAPALAVVAEEEPKPRGADEFVCQSCFLVKHRRQLADPVRMLCGDCADSG